MPPAPPPPAPAPLLPLGLLGLLLGGGELADLAGCGPAAARLEAEVAAWGQLAAMGAYLAVVGAGWGGVGSGERGEE